MNQGIGKDVPLPTYPYGKSRNISPISTMGTLLGVHPIVPWLKGGSWTCFSFFLKPESNGPEYEEICFRVRKKTCFVLYFGWCVFSHSRRRVNGFSFCYQPVVGIILGGFPVINLFTWRQKKKRISSWRELEGSEVYGAGFSSAHLSCSLGYPWVNGCWNGSPKRWDW